MCGIILADLNKKAAKRLMKRYNKQQSRGKEGYGCISIDNGIIKNIYRSKSEGEMRKMIKHDLSSTMLLHHRKPTSTPNVEEATHPIYVSNDKLVYDYYVTHNGVIDNAATTKKEFELAGYEYNTIVQEILRTKSGAETVVKDMFNDSESFAIDLAIALEENKYSIKSTGSIAFIAVQFNKENGSVSNIFFGRNYRNPLKIEQNDRELFISSEGGGKDVEPNKLFSYDIKTKEVKEVRALQLGIYHAPYVTPVTNRSINPVTGAHDVVSRNHTALSDFLSRTKSPTTVANELLDIAEGRDNASKLFADTNKNEGQITFYDSNSKKMRTYVFKVFNGALFRTSIAVEDIGKMLDVEWEQYEKLTDAFEKNLDLLVEAGQTDEILTADEKRQIGNDCKSISLQFKYMSEVFERRKVLLSESALAR